MDKKPPRWRIQLRYKNGVVADTFINKFPTKTFWIESPEGPMCFEAYLTVLDCGEKVTLKKVIYRQMTTEDL